MPAHIPMLGAFAQRLAALEQRNEELEAFVRALAHDSVAITRGIALRTDMLRERLQGADHDVPELLRGIEDRAQRLGSMAAGLMRLARVGGSELEYDAVDVSGIAREILEELHRAQPEREIVLLVHPGLTAWADPVLVRLALENLVGNAWKYTAKTADPRIEIGCRKGHNESVFFVVDNGIGLPPAGAAALFAPFVRLNEAQAFEGTGLGLATVKRVVQRHGGWIRAESNGGRGALFLFTLGNDAIQGRRAPDAA